jgi:hypothetical protein
MADWENFFSGAFFSRIPAGVHRSRCRVRGGPPGFGHAGTFITSYSGSDYMHDVVSSKKMENGIVVFFEEKGEKTYESFNYSELVDMKINALDLLERPKSYKVDKDAHTLIVKK